MSSKHVEQLIHNSDFHTSVCDKFPDKFYDWKITVLFYSALHCIKAYYKGKNIDIGETHSEIEKSISPLRDNAPYKVDKGCWHHYKSLFRYSHTSRYDGIADSATFEKSLKADHAHCVEHLENVKKYAVAHGLKIEPVQKQ